MNKTKLDELDLYAYRGDLLPDSFDMMADLYYYLIMQSLYNDVYKGKMAQHIATDIKKVVRSRYEQLLLAEELYKDSIAKRMEINKITVPLVDLKSKNKTELLIIIHRLLKVFDGVGLSKEFDKESRKYDYDLKRLTPREDKPNKVVKGFDDYNIALNG